jgi:hypothetical protein
MTVSKENVTSLSTTPVPLALASLVMMATRPYDKQNPVITVSAEIIIARHETRLVKGGSPVAANVSSRPPPQ